MKKNKSRSKFKTFFNRIFNVRTWIDWDRVKAGGQFIETGAKKYFVPGSAHPIATDTFEEVQQRLNLSDADLAQRARALYRMCIMMACISMALFLYGFYHLFSGSLHASLLTFVLTLLAAVMSFRYHFWYFQIKSRKLGCTFHEWYRQGLLGGKS